MNRIALFAAAALLLCFVSCKKEDCGTMHFTACMEQSDGPQGAKTYLGDDLFLRWDGTEQVKVFGTASAGTLFDVTPREGDATWADLQGPEIEGSTFTAIYPGEAAPSRSTIALGNMRQTVGGELGVFPMYAQSTDRNFQFKNLCGVLKIHLEQAGVSISEIDVISDTKLSGTYSISLVNGKPVLSYASGGVNTLMLTCSTPQNITDGRDFYIYLPPSGDEGYSLQLRFYQPDRSVCTKSCPQRVVVGRNEIVNISLGSSLDFVPRGALRGRFSVAEGRQVFFSKGNLQWSAVGSHAVSGSQTAEGRWRFAEHQYDIIGADNQNIASDYAGYIDLFGWGTSGCGNVQPYLNGYLDSYAPHSPIEGTGYDWGVYNAIYNGGDAPGLWRTLTQSEWSYLYSGRANAMQRRAMGRVETAAGSYVNGLILMPDVWTAPSDIAISTAQGYQYNTFTLEQWALMEEAGTLFLPAAGWRNASTEPGPYNKGYYWTSSTTADNDPCAFYIEEHNGTRADYAGSDWCGYSVRLVRNAQ